jgi:hypothetical protein
MSLRPVELQFALHKNDEAGLKQNQLNNKPIQDQSLLAEASAKQTEKERQIAGKADNVNQSSVRDQEKEKSDRLKKSARTRRNTSQTEEKEFAVERSDHPFKGKHIDLLL